MGGYDSFNLRMKRCKGDPEKSRIAQSANQRVPLSGRVAAERGPATMPVCHRGDETAAQPLLQMSAFHRRSRRRWRRARKVLRLAT